MEFRIEPVSRTPIYRQLVAQIREAVARGRLKPEERLPSVRDLSRQLVINPNTVARVYTELEREGILNTRLLRRTRPTAWSPLSIACTRVSISSSRMSESTTTS